MGGTLSAIRYLAADPTSALAARQLIMRNIFTSIVLCLLYLALLLLGYLKGEYGEHTMGVEVAMFILIVASLTSPETNLTVTRGGI